MAEGNNNQPRTVLVTGGNRGIGLAIARRFAADGHRVAITYRSAAPEPGVLPHGVLAVAADVTSAEQVDAAFAAVEEAFGPVEIVVSNAGITRDTLVLRMSEDDFTSVLDANLTGGFRVAKRAVRSMMRQRYGRIVFISSVVGLVGQAGQANYAASKAGLHGLTASLAKEYGRKGITANVVVPGFFDTDMTRETMPAQAKEYWAQYCPMPKGRMGTIQELATVVTFLAGPGGSYINGQVIPVTGGLDWTY